MFDRLLIANRGEIACRIVRTARRMGITSVAIYSDADAQSLHVASADLAVRVGPSPARESYLDISRVIGAARRTGAQAIHPGYGFLSENADFAEACAEAGLIFVGPPAAAMRAMGSKASAKTLMETSGVPLLPGYHGAEQDPAVLASEADWVGYPLVIKAVAGGGGRGMRVVHTAGEFADALQSAKQEGRAAFGDDRVLIERYLDRPRHIEVQVFGDSFGQVVHLFERDCSAQRRHQKVIEEAPAPGLDAARRAAMGQAAVAAARAVSYVGAGTVEFVADESGFFFLEMNTRLQVEHPVTELVTGVDLVEWQLRVAAGEPLPLTQDAICLDGHAIEARLYAEDPARDFAPSVGRLAAFRLPETVRVDTGFRTGDTVSVHYDAMMAKLIAHAPTRDGARLRLLAAVQATFAIGVATNLDLLGGILASDDFKAGAVDTGFIQRDLAHLTHTPPPSPDILAAATLGQLAAEAAQAREAASAGGNPHSPWAASDGFWLNTARDRTLAFVIGETEHDVVAGADGRLTIGDRVVIASGVAGPDGDLIMTLDGVRVRVAVHRSGRTTYVHLNGRSWAVTLSDPLALLDDDAAAGGRLTAPIPGQISTVLAEPGQAVKRGEVLVVMEAMKTVFRLAAKTDGVVDRVACARGDYVDEGALLVAFVEADG